MKKVLFVCTGNTCRSSMAEGIFNSQVAADIELKGRMTSVSAGLASYNGECASVNAVNVLKKEYGIDITAHRSRLLDDKMLKDSDLILTMTREHKRVIISKCPEVLDKVFTLKEYSGNEKNTEEYDFMLDIVDPYGMPMQIYKRCAEEIKQAISNTILKLRMS